VNLPKTFRIRVSHTSFPLTSCLIYIIFSANVCKVKKVAESPRVVPALETKVKIFADFEDGKEQVVNTE
jgi:hypothetical protein